MNFIKAIENNYDLKIKKIFPEIGGWSALAYKIMTSYGDYFLKIYEKSRASTTRLVSLIDTYLLAILHIKSTSDLAEHLPTPIKTKSDEFKFEDNYGVYIVYEYIDGQTIGSNELTTGQIKQLSEIITKLHTYNTNIPIDISTIREDFYLPYIEELKNLLLIGSYNAPEELITLLAKYSKVISKYMEIVLELSSLISRQENDLVLCHTDIHNWNLMVKNDRLILIDWEGLKLAPREADLMFLEDKPFYNLFLETYSKTHKYFRVNKDILLYYKIKRKIDDIWDYVEQILYDKGNKLDVNKTIEILEDELENQSL